MKNLRWMIGVVLMAALAVAQADEETRVELKVDSKTLMLGEPVLVTVDVSADVEPVELPRHLNSKSNLTFQFDKEVKPQKKPDHAAAFADKTPRKNGVATYNLLDFFALEAGTYKVRAIFKEGNSQIESNEVTITIESPATDLEKQALGRLHHLPWANYEFSAYCGDTFELVQKWSESRLVKYCHFYNGRFLQNQKKFEDAIKEYQKVLSFPKFAWTDDAEYFIGMCLMELGKVEEAKAQLNKVAKQYPHTDAAEDAKALLQKIGNAQ